MIVKLPALHGIQAAGSTPPGNGLYRPAARDKQSLLLRELEPQYVPLGHGSMLLTRLTLSLFTRMPISS